MLDSRIKSCNFSIKGIHNICVVPVFLRKEFKFSIGGFAVHNMSFLKACKTHFTHGQEDFLDFICKIL